MNILQVVAFGVLATIIITVIKNENKEIALCLGILSSVLILLQLTNMLDGIFSMIDELIEKSGINKEYLTIVFKAVGITYIVEFGKNVCEDAGQQSIASKLELVGKVSIMYITIPIFSAIIKVVSGLV